MSTPRTALTRSPGGLLNPNTSSEREQIPGRSSSSDREALSTSSLQHKGPPSHRSTDTLGYYFSSYAGGNSSSSSSLAMSPQNSNEIPLSSSPTSSFDMHTTTSNGVGPEQLAASAGRGKVLGPRGQRSQTSLNLLTESASPAQQTKSNPYPYTTGYEDLPGGGPGTASGSKIPIMLSPLQYTKGLQGLGVDGQASPGGFSDLSSASRYSGEERSSPTRLSGSYSDAGGSEGGSLASDYGNGLGLGTRMGFNANYDSSDDEEREREPGVTGLMGDEMDRQWELERGRRSGKIDARESVQSEATVRQTHFEEHSTPMPAPHQSHTPTQPLHPAHTPIQGSQADATPTIGDGRAQTLGTELNLNFGRMTMGNHPDLPGRSDGKGVGRTAEPTLHIDNDLGEGVQSSVNTPNEFGLRLDDDDEETLKGRGAGLPGLPATTSTSSGAIVEAMLSPSNSSTDHADQSSLRGPSPSKSPQPPPRSTLRSQLPLPSPQVSRPLASTATSSTTSFDSQSSRDKDLPAIINTASSPEAARLDNNEPRRPSRSPSRAPSLPLDDKATLQDLTNILGGAIDAIGLIDSRETPPPSVMTPTKDLVTSPTALAPPADLPEKISREASSIPKIEPSSSSPAVSLPPRSFTQTFHQAVSTVSLHSTVYTAQPPLISTPTARPWPAAMLYGNVKNMKTAGDRAKAYARAINELARAESGLKDWCAASARTAHSSRPIHKAPSKMYAMGSLGTPSSATLITESSHHPRQVSTSSEFPMRADSYTAREISSRLIDPNDQPTSLPANLPYPQLQYQHTMSSASSSSNGIKPSQSMQSLSGFGGKRNFFQAAMGRMGGRKDNHSISGLGPPTGSTPPPTSAAKKDIRGMSISSPTMPQHTDGQSQSQARGLSAPLGPRGPRGSYTPPPSAGLDRSVTDNQGGVGRTSLDTSLSRLPTSQTFRGSFDSGITARSGKPSLSSSGAGQGLGIMGIGAPPPRASASVKEEDVRAMADVLPQIEKGVLRIYLQRYREPLLAIGAILEDEKRGALKK